jgi:alkylation response protein AidB-like acyl-CoA dehydrogenase
MNAGPPSDPGELLAGVQEFVSATVLPNVADWDREDRLPAAALQTMLDLGLPGALVPSRYGGRGFSVLDMVPVWRTLSQGWISLAGAINPSALATTLLLPRRPPGAVSCSTGASAGSPAASRPR